MELRTISDRENAREAILDAVGALLARHGYRKMTVEDIAHEAGIGKGTAYLYFPSKEEMALGWIDRANDNLQAEMWEIAQSSDPPAERIHQLLFTRVLRRLDTAQQFGQGLDDLFAAIRPAFFERRTRYRNAEALIIAEALSDGRREGVFAFDDAVATAHALLLATNSLLPYGLSVAQLGQRDEISESVQRIADLLLCGLLKR